MIVRKRLKWISHNQAMAYGITLLHTTPDSKVHGAYMGPIWGRQDPGGSHVGPMNLTIRDTHPFRLIIALKSTVIIFFSILPHVVNIVAIDSYNNL